MIFFSYVSEMVFHTKLQTTSESFSLLNWYEYEYLLTEVIEAEGVQHGFERRRFLHRRAALTHRLREFCRQEYTVNSMHLQSHFCICLMRSVSVWGLTFGEGADVFGQRCQTRVVLRWEAIAVQSVGPRVSMTGQHGSAALLHGHTHATTGLDEPADVITYV